MGTKCKIIIVDDHDMFREGVKVLLGKSPNIEFIGEAVNGADFLKLLETKTPDVVLMDISMPVMDGIEASRLAMKQNPDLKILVLSMFGEEEYYYKMIQAGVRGFVMKSSGINELDIAIKDVARGACFFSPELLQYVINNIGDSEETDVSCDLNETEKKVLLGIAKNLSNDEIAQQTSLALDEVSKIHNDLLKKSGSNNTAALVMFAIKTKIINI
jgi:DNA-binding NarL/FixJ family response regulator